jgi:hypothetical protein
MVDSITLLLKEKFAEVILIDDFQRFKADRLDTAAVVDVYHKDNTWSDNNAVVDMRVLFFDNRIRKIGEARGTATRNYWTNPEGPTENSTRKLQVQALRQFAEQLSLVCR